MDPLKVQADYAFKQHVSKGGGNSNDGFGVSLQHDLPINCITIFL